MNWIVSVYYEYAGYVYLVLLIALAFGIVLMLVMVAVDAYFDHCVRRYNNLRKGRDHERRR